MRKFKTIDVELEGKSSLLMNSALSMLEEATMKKNPTKNYDHKEEAKKASYRNKAGNLFIPTRAMKACLINAASWYKFGKRSAKQIIAGCTTIEPLEEIELTDKKGKPIVDYEIDLRPVVVQRARIIRARPKISEWYLRFKIIYNSEMIGDANIIQQILEEAGQRIGLLDNRPQKYGENGTFVVTKFKEI